MAKVDILGLALAWALGRALQSVDWPGHAAHRLRAGSHSGDGYVTDAGGGVRHP